MEKKISQRLESGTLGDRWARTLFAGIRDFSQAGDSQNASPWGFQNG